MKKQENCMKLPLPVFKILFLLWYNLNLVAFEAVFTARCLSYRQSTIRGYWKWKPLIKISPLTGSRWVSSRGIKSLNSDCIVNKAFSKEVPSCKTEGVWNYFRSLKGQCILIKHGIEVSMVKDIKSRQMLVKRSLVNIHNFCRRYFICGSC